MRWLQLDRLDQYTKYRNGPGIHAIRFWIKDIVSAFERCAYCGWFLNPQLLFKGIYRPMKMTYWKEDTGEFVCSKCHYLKKELYAQTS